MMARISTVCLVVCVTTGIVLAGCSGDVTTSPSGTLTPTSSPAPTQSPSSAPKPSASPAPAPSPPRPEGATHGVETCDIVDASYDGNVDREGFRCVELTNDPRVNGTWEAWIVTTETGDGLGSWKGDLVMTNTGGIWRGTASGAVTGIPNSPTNYSEVVWKGEGDYAGLVYHELIHGTNSKIDVAGWIEPET